MRQRARDELRPYGAMLNNYEGGNVDLRVPYIGYSSESESYTAAGIAAYHALTSHLEKRLSHGFQAGVSYTFSHATDEQSGLGLFYNGNNPNNLRSGYGSADFDRTHVLNFTYGLHDPKFLATDTLAGKVLDSWGIHGIAIIQSGQPYSVIDYSGAVGSIFYSTFDGIINPIVPLAPAAHGRMRSPARTARSTTQTPRPAPRSKPAASLPIIRRAHGRSRRRPLRDRLHHRPAQHLPPGLAEARRCLPVQGTAHPRSTHCITPSTSTTSPTLPASIFRRTT